METLRFELHGESSELANECIGLLATIDHLGMALHVRRSAPSRPQWPYFPRKFDQAIWIYLSATHMSHLHSLREAAIAVRDAWEIAVAEE